MEAKGFRPGTFFSQPWARVQLTTSSRPQVLRKLLGHPAAVRAMLESGAVKGFDGSAITMPLLRFGFCKVRCHVGLTCDGASFMSATQ